MTAFMNGQAEASVAPAVQMSLGPGAKLLCIDDRNLRRRYRPGPPVCGRIYCLRELYVNDGVPGVLLCGIRGPNDYDGLECGFRLTRFKWVHD